MPRAATPELRAANYNSYFELEVIAHDDTRPQYVLSRGIEIFSRQALDDFLLNYFLQMIKLRYVFLVAAVATLVHGEPLAEREITAAQQLEEALEAIPNEAAVVREKRHLLAKKALLLGGGALLGKKALVLGSAKALLGAGALGATAAGLYRAKS